jgi:hypothetical protein
MKITIDIDCSPQEARSFLGLPDVEPLQSALMEKIQAEMMAQLSGMDAQAMFKQWMPGAADGAADMMTKFWSGMGVGGADKK